MKEWRQWSVALAGMLVLQACSYQWSEESVLQESAPLATIPSATGGSEFVLRVAYVVVGAEGPLNWQGVLQQPPVLLPLVLDPSHGGRAGYALLTEGQEVKDVSWQGNSVAYDARVFEEANPDGSFWVEIVLPNLQPVASPAPVVGGAARFVGARMTEQGARHFVVPVHSQGDLSVVPVAVRHCQGLLVDATGRTLAGVRSCHKGILTSQDLPQGYAVQEPDFTTGQTETTPL